MTPYFIFKVAIVPPCGMVKLDFWGSLCSAPKAPVQLWGDGIALRRDILRLRPEFPISSNAAQADKRTRIYSRSRFLSIHTALLAVCQTGNRRCVECANFSLYRCRMLRPESLARVRVDRKSVV